MNVARDNILRRVRSALRTTAPRPAQPTTELFFPTVTDLETRFREEFTALHGEILETDAALRQFQSGFQRITTDDLAGLRSSDLGVTGCDCLVAQTGSIFVSTRSAGGRALSVLPPVHLVLARRDQLVPDLPAAFALLRQRYGGRWPSAVTMITGPSRTADIEKILVMGAHGPKRLVAYFEA
jgi:L-lactate dehydrogenase complex protein LldG